MTDTNHSEYAETMDRAPESSYDCPYCGARFARDQYRLLHMGLEHDERLDDSEREAYREAYEAEDQQLRLFRLKALLALVVLYFGFLFAYSIFA